MQSGNESNGRWERTFQLRPEESTKRHALKLFDRFQASKQRGYVPNLFVVMNLMRSLAVYGDYRRCAFVMLASEERYGQEVPGEAYLRWMQSLSRGGQSERVVSVLEHMKSRGLTPSEHVYVTALKELGNSGNLKEMQKMKEEVEERGPGLTERMYATIIHAYGKHNRLKKAQLAWREMGWRKLKPDRTCYTAFMQAHTDCGKPRAAALLYEYFVDMVKKRDVMMYIQAVVAYGAIGQVKDAAKAYQEPLTRGMYIPEQLHHAFIKCLIDNHHLRWAEEIFEGIRPTADSGICHLMLNAYAATGRLEDFENMFSHVEHHYGVRAETFDAVRKLKAELERRDSALPDDVKNRLEEMVRTARRDTRKTEMETQTKFMPPPREPRKHPRDLKLQRSKDRWDWTTGKRATWLGSLGGLGTRGSPP